ncbi:MAG: pentapeptide repeat-containing protein, partial [Rhodospirillaceae bacterium]|nr:pentapeptide repeat-containing protein [Rhodospirillaceae bacterium]
AVLKGAKLVDAKMDKVKLDGADLTDAVGLPKAQ